MSCPECGLVFRAGFKGNACPECGTPLRRRPLLSGGMVPNDGQGIRKPRSILRENLVFFAVFIPLVLVAAGAIFLIISWVQSAGK